MSEMHGIEFGNGSNSSGNIIAYIIPASDKLVVYNKAACEAIGYEENRPHRVPYHLPGLHTGSPANTTLSRGSADTHVLQDFCQGSAIAIDLDKPTGTSSGFVLGRQSSCSFIFPESFGSVSAQHLSFTFDERYNFVVKDMGSTLGFNVRFGTSQPVHCKDKAFVIAPLGELGELGPIIVKLPGSIKFEIRVNPFNPACSDFRRKADLFRNNEVNAQSSNLLAVAATRVAASGGLSPVSNSDQIRMDLGGGAYANTFLVVDLVNNRHWVEKILRNPNTIDVLEKEAHLLHRARHANIVKCFGVFDTSPRALRLEYARYRSLATCALMGESGESCSAEQAVAVAKQTLSAVAHLHNLNPSIAHRDISAQNILVYEWSNSHVYVKLADFGVSKEGSDIRTFSGTLRYLSPELYLCKSIKDRAQNSRYTLKVDIWSLAVVLAEISCGLPPLDQPNYDFPWCGNIIRFVSEQTEGRHTALVKFLRDNMLHEDPTRRKDAAQCYSELSSPHWPGLELSSRHQRIHSGYASAPGLGSGVAEEAVFVGSLDPMQGILYGGS